MKSFSRNLIFIGVIAFGCIIACSNSTKKETSTPTVVTTIQKEPSKAFKKYWYAGKAELTSYTLEQARYGEIHSGKAVLIYVTEDFNPEKQVKADYQNATNIPILKLNSTKKFYTGIYPYSVMTSTFYPVNNNQHVIKNTTSIQEWCGHVFTQLNNKKQFDIQSFSYFESESDQKFSIEKSILEDELWTQLRIDPKSLPIGEQQIIPSFEYLRLRHIPMKAYKAVVKITESESISTYEVQYPELNRTLAIEFNKNFPYDIIGWKESFKSGFGSDAKVLQTKATKIKQLKSPYWSKNGVKDSTLRKKLGL